MRQNRGTRAGGCGLAGFLQAMLLGIVTVSVFRMSSESAGTLAEVSALRGRAKAQYDRVAALESLAKDTNARIGEEITTRREATEGLVKAVKTVDERSRAVAERLRAADETAKRLADASAKRDKSVAELRLSRGAAGGALEARVRSLETAAHTSFQQEVHDLESRLRALEAAGNVESPDPRPRFTAPPRHLVMAMAAGYGMRDFRRFVDTMRLGAKYDGDCALFVLKDTSAIKSREFGPWQKARRVELVYVDEGPGWKVEPGGLYYTVDGWGPGVPAAVVRYKHYAWFLDKRDPYDVVLWSDFRDAFWQRNPFDDFAADGKGKGLVFFSEHPVKPLDKDGFSRGWVETCWGRGVLDAHVPRGSDTPCLCSGQAMGTGTALLGYLKRYLAAVDAQHRKVPHDKCVTTYGIDQGHHNYLVYTQLEKATFEITPWDAGPVATIGFLKHVPPAELRRDEAGFVLRRDGKRVAIVHQYDRISALNAWLPKYVKNLLKGEK